MNRPTVSEANALLFLRWLAERGGVAVWRSVDLSDLGKSWSTPGDAEQRPSWQAAGAPERVVTDPAEIDVVIDREVKRFHMAMRVGSSGIKVKCTDASSSRIRREVEKAGDGAYHVFDYETQEAVIMALASRMPLSEWKERTA